MGTCNIGTHRQSSSNLPPLLLQSHIWHPRPSNWWPCVLNWRSSTVQSSLTGRNFPFYGWQLQRVTLNRQTFAQKHCYLQGDRAKNWSIRVEKNKKLITCHCPSFLEQVAPKFKIEFLILSQLANSPLAAKCFDRETDYFLLWLITCLNWSNVESYN